MVEAILQVRREPSLGRTLGRNGRQAVLQKYLRSKRAAEYLELLNELRLSTERSPSARPLVLRKEASATESRPSGAL